MAEFLVDPYLSAETGPVVHLATMLPYQPIDDLTPDGARELALRLWDAADEAEGLRVSPTEPSPR